eukprot:c19350_g1_i2.p1 GENE.c19350_g1_i2~~c19350_g1_i2.p1  ORF type:complete len:522 (+),score=84.89 c19350_g1_i2:42-1568(+)
MKEGEEDEGSTPAQQLVEGTTIHGIPRIIDAVKNKDRFFTIYWLVLFLLALVLFLLLVSSRIKFFLSNPKVTSTDVSFEIQMPFPAVTICNNSPLDSLRMQTWAEQGFPNSNNFCFDPLLLRCPADCDSELIRLCNGTCVDPLSLTAQSEIVSCAGNCVSATLLSNGQCDPELRCSKNFFDAGECPEFSEEEHFIAVLLALNRSLTDPTLPSRLSWSKFDLFSKDNCKFGSADQACSLDNITTSFANFDTGNCFTLNLNSSQTKPGFFNGITLAVISPRDRQVLVSNFSTAPFFAESEGFQLMIHEPGSQFILSNALTIPIGRETSIELQQTDFTDRSSGALCNSSPEYSFQDCFKTCLEGEFGRRCATAGFLLACVGDNEFEVLELCHKPDRCLAKCKFTRYSPSVSQSIWPSDAALGALEEVGFCNAVDCRGVFPQASRLRLYFGEFIITNVSPTFKYRNQIITQFPQIPNSWADCWPTTHISGWDRNRHSSGCQREWLHSWAVAR